MSIPKIMKWVIMIGYCLSAFMAIGHFWYHNYLQSIRFVLFCALFHFYYSHHWYDPK